MKIKDTPVKSVIKLNSNIHLLEIYAPDLAEITIPGEFYNIKVSQTDYPLLRRPFSICDIEGEHIYFMFNVVGEGTELLSKKREGDTINLLGPLGKGFNIDDDYDTAVIAAGGLGTAPFPLLRKKIKGKRIASFVGGRNSREVVRYGFDNLHIATDDGSEGFHGNVVELLDKNLERLKEGRIKIFACGPNPMLRALQEFCRKYSFNCEVSMECAMACGFGICQGCPIESSHDSSAYKLVCKDGPVFNVKDVII